MCSVRRCFVPGCKTGYPSDRKLCKQEGRKCLALFCVPRNEKMLEKWKLAIPRSKREFNWTDSVCEKHFHEDDINRYYIKTLPDGTSHVLERKKAKLKSASVPAIFPSSSECIETYQESVPPKISEQETLAAPVSPKAVVHNQMDNLPVDGQDTTVTNSQVEILLSNSDLASLGDMDYEPPNDQTLQGKSSTCHKIVCNGKRTYLSKCLKFVKLPSHWSIHATANNYVVCAKWMISLEIVKKVIIKDNLSIKVFVNDVEVKKIFDKITSADDVSLLVNEVNKYVSCRKFERNENCIGILSDHDFRQGHSKCHSCQQLFKNMVIHKTENGDFRKILPTEERLYERLIQGRKKYAALKKEIAELKKKIQNERTVNKELSKLDELFF